MHVRRELSPIERALAERLPHLRPPQRRGLALWVLGAVLAQSACQSAALAALLVHGRYHALRQRPREWLLDGTDKAAPCAAQVEAEACFAPLLRWVLGWWQGRELALAVDATAPREDVVALVVGVLYRGSAIPVAWAILPGNTPGPWLGPILRLLRLLRPAVPPGWTVLVLADRGLWSPRLWRRVRRLGWHPLLRSRRGKNTRHRLLGLLRQAVYSRLAGYEDVDDAERLARDPAMRAIVGREGLARSAASGSEMGRFETEWLATEANLAALTDLSGAWIDRVHARRPPDGIILDNLAAPQPAVLRAPAGVGHFRYPDRPHRLGHCPTLRRRHVDLPQLADDLLGRVPLPRHLRVLHLAQGHTLGRTTSKGAGQSHTSALAPLRLLTRS